MPTIQGATATGAGLTTLNVLAGSIYEYLPWNAQVEFGLVAEAAGESRVTVNSGSDTIMEESPVSRAARVPIYPDDYPLVDVAAGGERLVIRHRNTGVGTNTLFWAVRLTPL
jgi:hypothetical protein